MSSWPFSSGEMAERIRAFDWSATPLGPAEGWPESLRAAVDMMLAAPQLATLAAGPERLFFYNDEAARHYGDKHPGALGRPLPHVFAHEFERVAGFYDRVFAGESVHVPAQPLDPAQTGTEKTFDAYLTPVRDSAGEVIAAHMSGVATDGRDRAEAALRENEERFAQFAAASSDGLWVRDAASFDMEYASPAVEAMYGVPPDALLGGIERWTALILAEDRDTATAHLKQARAGESVVHEFRIRRPADGAIRWVRNTDFPLHDAAGRLTRIGGIAEDVTEAKRLAEHQLLLLAELQHRVRNILAVVRSVFNRTVGAGGDVEDVADHFQGRLDSLARTHVIVTGTSSGSVDLENLIRDELLSVGVSDGPVLTLDGPEVLLPANAAESIGLAVHELTTNALKYGAIKFAGAKLNIRWSVNPDYSGEQRLDLIWTEQGVPAVPIRPTRQGFGTELIIEALPYRLGAETSLEFRGGGVRCTISLPLPPEGAFGGANRESALM